MVQRRFAFTLIELLIVVGVLALLAGLLFPSLHRARVLAQRVYCRKNLQNVSVAMRMYLNDSNNVMPLAAQLPSAELNDLPRIADVLARYLSGPDTLRCPADTEKNYFASEGSSYEYASMLGGRKVGDSFLTRRWGEAKTPVMYDYEPFHGPPGELGSGNYLFVDGHVGSLE
jgi:prepilin-type N-terminal cleavage/methylation domain-containing protein/prepilin-type processing-associated H-X9-DG protein